MNQEHIENVIHIFIFVLLSIIPNVDISFEIQKSG